MSRLVVSVVLPTYNRLSRLKRVLQGFEEQVFPHDKFEAIVISDGSTDGTNEYLRILETGFCLRPIFQENGGPAAARNNGIAHAAADLVLFVDDDVVPTPTLIAEHVRSHQETEEDVVVIGPMLTPPSLRLSAWGRWMQDRLAEQYHAMETNRWAPNARQFYTGNSSLSRRLVLEVGGFDPSFRRAEDIELAYRLTKRGVRFMFNPRAVGLHYEKRSFDSWLNIAYVYGRNNVIFGRDKGWDWLLPVIYGEFQSRHPFIRVLTRLCLDREWLCQPLTLILKTVMEAGDRLQQKSLVRLGCSAIFNLYHYQGMADELGGRQHFFKGVLATAQAG